MQRRTKRSSNNAENQDVRRSQPRSPAFEMFDRKLITLQA